MKLGKTPAHGELGEKRLYEKLREKKLSEHCGEGNSADKQTITTKPVKIEKDNILGARAALAVDVGHWATPSTTNTNPSIG